MRDDAGYAPVLIVLAAIAILSGMDAVIKHVGAVIPVSQIVFLRYLMGTLAAVPIILLNWPSSAIAWRAHALRALSMMATAWLFFYALTRMPFAMAVTLTFCAPIFVVLLARPILGEPIPPRAVWAVLLGFAGVGVTIFGGIDSAGFGPVPVDGVAAAITAALCFALSVVLMRRHSALDPIPVMVVAQSGFALLYAAPAGLLVWQPVDGTIWLWFVLIGMLGTGGHLLFTWGFSRAAAARLAPIDYTALLWAIVFGYAFFSEIPSFSTIFGAAMIVIACLLAAGERPLAGFRRWFRPRRGA